MGNKRKWIILYFVALAAVGSIGFYVIGGDQWSWIDSLYMTILTLSTVGYAEVHTLTGAGKIWSILIIIFGVSGIGAFIRTLNEEFIQLALSGKDTKMKTISKLKNHYVICGYGRMGAVIAKELDEKNLNLSLSNIMNKKLKLYDLRACFV